MLNEIIEKMMDKKGEIKLSICLWKENEYYTFLLLKDNVLAYYVSLQYRNSKCYIDKLDSTGYCTGISKDFIISILSALSPSFISCFSHPKGEYIFKNSQKNNYKRIKPPIDLLNYWISVFKAYDKLKLYELFIWSNYFEESRCPYSTFEEINFFDDDPKTKVMQHMEKISVDKLFKTLLCRKDFIEGSLVYLVRSSDSSEDKDNRDSMKFTNLNAEISSADITSYLKELDFSNIENIKKSSKQFLNHFKVDIMEFKYKKRSNNKNDDNKSFLIKGKRRK